MKIKPSYITIEDLNVSGMMKNKHLSKTVASQKFYEFRIKLEAQCREFNTALNLGDTLTYKTAYPGICRYVSKAYSGIYDCGVYRNL